MMSPARLKNKMKQKQRKELDFNDKRQKTQLFLVFDPFMKLDKTTNKMMTPIA